MSLERCIYILIAPATAFDAEYGFAYDGTFVIVIVGQHFDTFGAGRNGAHAFQKVRAITLLILNCAADEQIKKFHSFLYVSFGVCDLRLVFDCLLL